MSNTRLSYTDSQMADQKRTLGSWGEQRAKAYLEERGYEIIAKNVRSAYGEIDLLARQGGTLVFVEVKSRSSLGFGYPEEAINELKQQHLLDCALDFLQSHPEHVGDWRIDVISILRSNEGPPEVEHFENAIHG
jgi:putative endonuclease